MLTRPSLAAFDLGVNKDMMPLQVGALRVNLGPRAERWGVADYCWKKANSAM